MSYHLITRLCSDKLPVERTSSNTGPGITVLNPLPGTSYATITTHGMGTWAAGDYVRLGIPPLLLAMDPTLHHVSRGSLSCSMTSCKRRASRHDQLLSRELWITPEPSTFVMLSIAALGLGGYLWRRRFASKAGTTV